jgi:hypothetical protein
MWKIVNDSYSEYVVIYNMIYLYDDLKKQDKSIFCKVTIM